MKKKKSANNRKKKKKSTATAFFLAVVIIVLICAACVAAANVYVIKSSEGYIITAEQASELDADCILVLGAKAVGDEMSAVLRDRVVTGIALFKAGASDRLLMSGDHGDLGYDEVYAMKKYALGEGIDASAVFCDHAGFSTYDSMYRAKAIFGCRKVIVVSQKFHIPRAIYLGRALGLEVYGVACDDGITYDTAAKNEAREVLARVKAIYSAIAKPEPTYLGEAIPISGDGTVTDDKTYE